MIFFEANLSKTPPETQKHPLKTKNSTSQIPHTSIIRTLCFKTRSQQTPANKHQQTKPTNKRIPNQQTPAEALQRLHLRTQVERSQRCLRLRLSSAWLSEESQPMGGILGCKKGSLKKKAKEIARTFGGLEVLKITK